MNEMMQSPFLRLLGWALFEFFWQGTVIAIAIAGVLFVSRGGKKPAMRYKLLCVGLAMMAFAPIITLSKDALGNGLERLARPLVAFVLLEQPLDGQRAALSVSDRGAVEQSTMTLEISISSLKGLGLGEMHGWMDRIAPWWAFAWIVITIVLFVRLLWSWALTRRLWLLGTTPAEPKWQERFERLCEAQTPGRTVKLLASRLVSGPSIFGWRRPVILTPESSFAVLSPEQFDAVMSHELAHIRRYDYLTSVAQGIAEAALFFHPAVWWISAQIRAERERSCDDHAVEACGSVFTYVSALTRLEEHRQTMVPMALHAGGDLLSRGRRLLEGDSGRRTALIPVRVLAIFLFFGVASFIIARSGEARGLQSDSFSEIAASIDSSNDIEPPTPSDSLPESRPSKGRAARSNDRFRSWKDAQTPQTEKPAEAAPEPQQQEPRERDRRIRRRIIVNMPVMIREESSGQTNERIKDRIRRPRSIQIPIWTGVPYDISGKIMDDVFFQISEAIAAPMRERLRAHMEASMKRIEQRRLERQKTPVPQSNPEEKKP
jgi:hypothetical protein